MTKEVQELKVSYENISYLKNQISSQFEDLRRRFEDEERVCIRNKGMLLLEMNMNVLLINFL